MRKSITDPEKRRHYFIWISMRNRCNCPGSKDYPFYGGRGISVCERWDDFDLFLADVGMRPSRRHTLDRIDNDGDYEPSNCRWVLRVEQSRNMRSNVRHTIDGVTKIQEEWCRIYGVSNSLFRSRLKRGMSIKESLLVPKRGTADFA